MCNVPFIMGQHIWFVSLAFSVSREVTFFRFSESKQCISLACKFEDLKLLLSEFEIPPFSF